MNPPPHIVPGPLDDAGLSVGAFRILSHLTRRAGVDGRCTPGARSIARVCKMGSRNTVEKYLRELTQRGAIVARRKQGSHDVHFRIVPYKQWIPGSVSGSHSEPEKPALMLKTCASSCAKSGPKGVPKKESIPGTRPGSSPKQRTADPRHRPLVTLWCEERQRLTGRNYVVTGQDAKQLQTLLSQMPQAPVGEVMDVARAAWKRRSFHCQRASSIAGLCTAWNEINAELASASHSHQSPDMLIP